MMICAAESVVTSGAVAPNFCGTFEGLRDDPRGEPGRGDPGRSITAGRAAGDIAGLGALSVSGAGVIGATVAGADVGAGAGAGAGVGAGAPAFGAGGAGAFGAGGAGAFFAGGGAAAGTGAADDASAGAGTLGLDAKAAADSSLSAYVASYTLWRSGASACVVSYPGCRSSATMVIAPLDRNLRTSSRSLGSVPLTKLIML